MKNILNITFIIIYATFSFGQEKGSSYTEKKIESGSTYKKYKNGKLDSVVVSMSAVNYANALIFSKFNDEIHMINSADTEAVVTIKLQGKKQVKTFLYQNKPVVIQESIDFDIKNLPKNAMVTSAIYNENVITYNISTDYEVLGDDSHDKIFKVFNRLNIQPDLDSLDEILENIADFFSEEDALLKIFYGSYAEKFEPQPLAYLQTDSLGKIKEGIFLDFKNRKLNDTNEYHIYKDGKIIKSENVSLDKFQKIIMAYLEKLDIN